MRTFLELLAPLILVFLVVVIVGYVAAVILAVSDAPAMEPRPVSPPYNTPMEDTAHYLTEQGEVIYAYH